MVLPTLLLITGATGHVGFCTLVHALRAGLDVRVTVRSETKARFLLSRVASQISFLDLGSTPTYQSDSNTRRPRLTFAIVPDISVAGAYDDVMVDVTHVIHVASPLSTGSQVTPISIERAESFFIKPAVQGTIGLLEAADRCGSVRRVVITSSVVALIPVPQMEGTETRPSNSPVRPTDRVPFTPGPYQTEFAAYANSKIASLDAAEQWADTYCPAFDIVYLHPSFVLGKNDVATSAADCMKGTNATVLAMLLGHSLGPLIGASVHVDDVARCHVEAAVELGDLRGRTTSYILSQPSTWNDAKEMAASMFPKAMGAKLISRSGDIETTKLDIDTSDTLETFDIDFQGFESQVKSLYAQFSTLKSAGTMRRPTSRATSRVRNVDTRMASPSRGVRV